MVTDSSIFIINAGRWKRIGKSTFRKQDISRGVTYIFLVETVLICADSLKLFDFWNLLISPFNKNKTVKRTK